MYFARQSTLDYDMARAKCDTPYSSVNGESSTGLDAPFSGSEYPVVEHHSYLMYAYCENRL